MTVMARLLGPHFETRVATEGDPLCKSDSISVSRTWRGIYPGVACLRYSDTACSQERVKSSSGSIPANRFQGFPSVGTSRASSRDPSLICPAVSRRRLSTAARGVPIRREAQWLAASGPKALVSKEQTLKVFNLIDWLLNLSAPLTLEFETQLHALEEELQMPYINSIERLALDRLEQAQNEAKKEREEIRKERARADAAEEESRRLRAELDRLRPSNGQVGPN